jgi:hypothetical protein
MNTVSLPVIKRPFRITFALDLFNSENDRDVSRQALNALLQALFEIDRLWLIKYPSLPNIYQSGVRYMEEPPGQEDWQDIPTCLRMGIGDCLPIDTLVLRDDYTFCTLAHLQPGDRIMGDSEFTTVQEVACTGEKEILAFQLNNGGVLRASPDHRLFTIDRNEIRAEDVKIGTRLLAPSKPFPTIGQFNIDDRLSNEEFAWLTGIYIADGWHQQKGNYQVFCISGFDDNPKRGKLEQKQKTVEICDKHGIGTSWLKKSVLVRDRFLAEFMHSCGTHAPNKRLPSMDWSVEQIKQLLLGLQTDCSTANSGTLTYGTTSETLALQIRILHRMLDQSVHIREWTSEQHRGLGQNSIWRIGIRKRPDEIKGDHTRVKAAENKLRSVKVVGIKEQQPEICMDITTDSGKFYLPETDLIVHNCEDIACWRAAELDVRHRISARPIALEQKRPDGGMLYHIVVRYPNGQIEDPSKILGMR